MPLPIFARSPIGVRVIVMKIPALQHARVNCRIWACIFYHVSARKVVDPIESLKYFIYLNTFPCVSLLINVC